MIELNVAAKKEQGIPIQTVEEFFVAFESGAYIQIMSRDNGDVIDCVSPMWTTTEEKVKKWLDKYDLIPHLTKKVVVYVPVIVPSWGGSKSFSTMARYSLKKLKLYLETVPQVEVLEKTFHWTVVDNYEKIVNL